MNEFEISWEILELIFSGSECSELANILGNQRLSRSHEKNLPSSEVLKTMNMVSLLDESKVLIR